MNTTTNSNSSMYEHLIGLGFKQLPESLSSSNSDLVLVYGDTLLQFNENYIEVMGGTYSEQRFYVLGYMLEDVPTMQGITDLVQYFEQKEVDDGFSTNRMNV